MRVLWVSAHPDPCSLTGALRDAGVDVLREKGHQVLESDLYRMEWNPVVSHADFSHPVDERLCLLEESQRALQNRTLSPDIQAEHEKLRWADTLVVQFPLWWFGPPAILKGWFDRLFVQGFAQGVLDPRTGRPRRYGDGGLTGRRALVVTTVGANAATTGARGIHGDITQVLFPLLHGTLWYSGMTVLPPVVINDAVRLPVADFEAAATLLRDRVTGIPDAEPIPFRHQNGGDYDEHLVLRPGEAPGERGLQIHNSHARS